MRSQWNRNNQNQSNDHRKQFKRNINNYKQVTHASDTQQATFSETRDTRLSHFVVILGVPGAPFSINGLLGEPMSTRTSICKSGWTFVSPRRAQESPENASDPKRQAKEVPRGAQKRPKNETPHISRSFDFERRYNILGAFSRPGGSPRGQIK